MKKYQSLPAVLLVFLLACDSAFGCAVKTLIGPLARVHLDEAGIDITGRVDTGAATTSIHAGEIVAANGWVSYTIVNGHGKAARLTSRIARESMVGNAESREQRYYVYLTISHGGRSGRTLVNLNDRGRSAYKLLLGRNWLSGCYIVDVDGP